MPKAPFIRNARSRRQYGDAAFCPLRPVLSCAVVRERCRFHPRCVPGAGFSTKSYTILLPSVYYLFCELQGELCVRSTFSVLLCPLFPKIVLRMEKMLIPRRAGSAPGLQKRAGDPERGLLQCGYLEYARKRKVTIWPRVQLSSGLNVVLEVPSVTLPETAQPTASA